MAAIITRELTKMEALWLNGAVLNPAFVDAYLDLFQNNVTPVPDTALSALNACDFVGYAQQNGFWSSFVDAAGDGYLIFVSEPFIAGALMADQTAYGFMVTDDAVPTKLFIAGRLPVAKVFHLEDQMVQITLKYSLRTQAVEITMVDG